MNMNPGITGQLAFERQREMLAQAGQLRLAREARCASRSAKQAAGAPRRTVRLFRRPRPVISSS